MSTVARALLRLRLSSHVAVTATSSHDEHCGRVQRRPPWSLERSPLVTTLVTTFETARCTSPVSSASSVGTSLPGSPALAPCVEMRSRAETVRGRLRRRAGVPIISKRRLGRRAGLGCTLAAAEMGMVWSVTVRKQFEPAHCCRGMAMNRSLLQRHDAERLFITAEVWQ